MGGCRLEIANSGAIILNEHWLVMESQALDVIISKAPQKLDFSIALTQLISCLEIAEISIARYVGQKRQNLATENTCQKPAFTMFVKLSVQETTRTIVLNQQAEL